MLAVLVRMSIDIYKRLRRLFPYHMIDLLQATRDYWKKLDEVEAAYKRSELSVPQVDARVHHLMAELGATRRQAFKDLWASAQVTISQQREAIATVPAIGLLAYLWLATVA